MTRPAFSDGGRVVALGGNVKLTRFNLVFVAAALGVVASCGQRPERAASSDPADAAVRVQSELVAMPATWNNLWGSWPQQRMEHASTYDTDRNLIVMYGGQQNTNGPYYGDTWEWNGTKGTWTQRTPSGKSPGARSGHAIAYDPVAKKTFMFSGWQPGASFFIPDQWEWDGTTSTWAERLIAGAQPSARHDHTMVYDPDRKKMVLFGGIDETGTRLNDVWDWDGAAGTWTQRTITGTKPVGRYAHTMVYDAGRKKFVVYGGNTGTGAGSFVNETWELDAAAGTWQQFTTTGTQPAYYYYQGYESLGYDPVTKKTVLYQSDDYLYEWDPATPQWKQVTVAGAATINAPSSYVTLTYDPVRAVIVVIAGISNPRTLWEFDTTGYAFTNRSVPVNGPIQRQYPAIAFDTKRGKLMLFGGRSSVDNLFKQDIWEWSGMDATFLQRTTVDTKPDGRYYSAMVYDSKRDRLLLYGGTGTQTYDDLWQWDPTTRSWSQITVTGTRPGALYGHSMFYDAVHDKVLLFYGSGFTFWEYDPALNTWKNRTQTPMPAFLNYRTNYELAFDSDRGKVVMLGGYTYVASVSAYVYDTAVLEWDTTLGTWEERPPAAGVMAPVGRYGHAIAYDSGRRLIVLYGGHANVTGLNADVDDSWEWDGNAKTWVETTPPGVRPLPRENHIMTYDTVRGSTYVFGGSVPADYTYGPQEIWEYVPNSAPRANGAGCSAANAAGCMSGNCVDGVCCAQTAAACSGMCQACNVPGMFGTCTNVPAGSPDDTCASDQACDATQKCKARIGNTCSTFADCATGHCADGVCCDTDCNDTCKVCNLNSKRGICSPVQPGLEDPGTCTSDPGQSRFCDGSGVCTNGPKATGKPCTASGQCLSTFCIDGFCCGTSCATTCYTCGKAGSEGTCTPTAAGLVDHSATTPCDGAMQYCTGAGSCGMNKLINGTVCTATSDCGSGFCVDGVCCNSACGGTCQGCNVAGSVGSCVNLKAGSQDANSVPACNGTQFCDAAGTCQSGLKANGFTCAATTECGSGNCVDGVCCDGACTDDCFSCNLPGTAGTCTGVVAGATDGKCAAPQYCTATHTCTMGRKANGTTCTMDSECGSSSCVDGVCCESACTGDCRSCAIAGSLGTCIVVPDGMDPRKKCTGDLLCGGACNGQGACRFVAAGTKCTDAGCQPTTGLITDSGKCDGAGHCGAMVTTPCMGFRCYTDAQGMPQCGKDCSKDPECALQFYCTAVSADGGADGGAADAGANASCPPVFDLAHACDRNAQCASGTCSDGVCCDNNCNKCGSCNLPGSVGHCVPVAAGTDPNNDCIDSASDPTGKCGGMCDGHARCLFPAAGSTCGTCKACNGGGLCNIKPDDDDACGTIDCDTLDTSCMDFHDLTTKRCGALGTCKVPNNATSCTDVTNTCGADGGAGAGGAGGGAGGSVGGSGTTGNNDGSSESKAGGGGGGCGCEVGGTGLASGLPLLGLLFGIVLTARRRRR